MVAVARHLRGKHLLEGSHVCLTFHTDESSDWDVASHVLRELAVSATFFVSADRAMDSTLDRIALGKLVSAGFEIGYRIDEGSKFGLAPSDRRKADFYRLRHEVGTLGAEARALAYFGDGGGQRRLLQDAAIAGFGLGLCGSLGINSLRPISPMMLKRMVPTDFAAAETDLA